MAASPLTVRVAARALADGLLRGLRQPERAEPRVRLRLTPIPDEPGAARLEAETVDAEAIDAEDATVARIRSRRLRRAVQADLADWPTHDTLRVRVLAGELAAPVAWTVDPRPWAAALGASWAGLIDLHVHAGSVTLDLDPLRLYGVPAAPALPVESLPTTEAAEQRMEGA